MLIYILACTAVDKTADTSDTHIYDTDTGAQLDSENDTNVDSDTSGNDTDSGVADEGLTFDMVATYTSGQFYGITALDMGTGEPRWMACDPLAVRGGACYLIDPDMSDLQDDYLSRYVGDLSYLGVNIGDVGDGQVCSSDYEPSLPNGESICWTPIEGEDVDVLDVADIVSEGDAGAYYGTGSVLTNDGSRWVSQTGDGDDPTTVAIYELADDGSRTLIVDSVCFDSTQYGAMDMLPLGEGVIVGCYGLGASYVTRDGVQWYWDAREQEIVSPELVESVDYDDVVDDRVTLSPWTSGAGDKAVIVSNLIGHYNGYLMADGTFFLVSGWSYAQTLTDHGMVAFIYDIAYGSDGLSKGTISYGLQAAGEEGLTKLDLPYEMPYAEVWRMAASTDGYVLAAGIDSSYGAILHVE